MSGRKKKLNQMFKTYLSMQANKPPPLGPPPPAPPPIAQAQNIEEEERESFEVIEGAARPAISHNRSSGLKWKEGMNPNPGSVTEKEQADKSSATQKEVKDGPPAAPILEANDKTHRMRKAKRTKVTKTDSTSKLAEPEGGSDYESAGTMPPLPQTVAGNKPAPGPEKKEGDEEEIDEATVAIAVRVLEILKRNQLMERALNYQETCQLSKFFGAGTSTPTEAIVFLLDKSIGTALDFLVNRPNEIDDVIDMQMRVFLMQLNNAKAVLLDVMLSRNQFIPISWGGKGSCDEKNQAVSTKSVIRRQKSLVHVATAGTGKGKPSPQQSPDTKSSPKTVKTAAPVQYQKSQYLVAPKAMSSTSGQSTYLPPDMKKKDQPSKGK